jgi:hypothetical protein
MSARASSGVEQRTAKTENARCLVADCWSIHQDDVDVARDGHAVAPGQFDQGSQRAFLIQLNVA